MTGGLGLLGFPALAAARTATRPFPATKSLRTSTARLGVGGSLETFEQEIDREVAVYRSYRNWGQAIIDPTINQLLERTPPPRLYLSVHAFFDAKGRNVIRWADIAAGIHDAQIDEWSDELLQVTAETPVYMCFHHEMENEEGTCGTPADFQNAYWYFRSRVEVVNEVPNLTWVVTYMENTFRGKHGGPGRWWPGASQFGLPVDQLMGVDLTTATSVTARPGASSTGLLSSRGSSPGRSAGPSSSASAAASRQTSVAERVSTGPPSGNGSSTHSSTCGTPRRRSAFRRSGPSATRTRACLRSGRRRNRSRA